ncbi:MAG: 2-oxoacid:acceptor oxidoreductase subunit alpha [Candidatus Thermoplasmatota archaeon]|nr:2-oxoacid:acceptor oxidoreductase subunit alpha [Candidatus Thermoplasmatota archaeon]
MKLRFLSGNEACAEGAILAKCRFFAGYPITPSTEIAERLALRLPQVGGKFIQMEDELASLAACIGASWAGAKAMTATSGPGFSLMQENIGYAVMTETPVVIVNVQRGGPSTGQATRMAQGDVMQARYGSHGDYNLIVLAPFSAQESLDLTIRAFNLAEEYRTPVILLSDAVVGHIREKVIVPEKPKIINRKKTKKGTKFFGLNAAMPKFGTGSFVHVTGSTHQEDGMRRASVADVQKRMVEHFVTKIENNKEKILEWEENYTDDAKILLVSFGCSARACLEAVKKARENNIRLGLFRPITLWPSPEKRLSELSEKVEKIILVQHSLIGYKPEVERIVGRKLLLLPKLGGKLHTSDEILRFVKEVR